MEGEPLRLSLTEPLYPSMFPPELVTSFVLVVLFTTLVTVAVLVVFLTKSAIATPLTDSLKVARKVRLSALVGLLEVDYNVKDVRHGAVFSSV
jgi:hypothetical protein